MVFNTGPYNDLPDNSILNTANMQSETGFPSCHQLKSYIAYNSHLKLAARAVLSADAGLLVLTIFPRLWIVLVLFLFTALLLLVLVMAALWNRAGHYIFALWFPLSSFFFFSSADLSGCRLDVYHTSTHGVALVQI